MEENLGQVQIIESKLIVMLISSVPFALNFFTVINSLIQDYTVEITFYWV